MQNRKAALPALQSVNVQDDNSSWLPPPAAGDQLPGPRQEGIAIWAAIEQTLFREISVGRYQPGEQLPTEHALAERFAVNRHTVRQALAHLATRGIIRITHGRGSFVSEWAIDYVLGKRTRFSRNLAAIGLTGQHRVMEIRNLAATAKVATILGMPPGETVTLLITAGEAGGRVISVGEHFFPPRFANIGEAVTRTGSISLALAEHGIADYTRKRSEITARLPDAQTARRLGQAESRPVLCVEGINVCASGETIEFGRTYFPGDQLQLVVEHDNDD
jgi:GntR family phosphonate transport system transcriptional regulator